MKLSFAKIFIAVLVLLCLHGDHQVNAGDIGAKSSVIKKVFMEKSLVVLKPDCIQKRMIGNVIGRLENAGLNIINCKVMYLDEKILKDHYSHIAHLPFFPEIVEFMSSSPVIVMVVGGDNAIGRVRNLLGSTDSQQALSGTIRGDLGTDKMRNIAHASDSKESAKIEIVRFFGSE